MRLFYWTFLTFTIVSCHQNKQYKYNLIRTDSKSSNSFDTEIISAESDSSAYLKGLSSFTSAVKAHQLIPEASSAPSSFIVLNEKGVDIATLLHDSTKRNISLYLDRILKDTRETENSKTKKIVIDSADQKKAFGDLVFGMSKKEVGKKEPEVFQNVGAGRYVFGSEYDHNEKLFKVTLESFEKTANYYDTEVRKDFNNLVSVITEKYGSPEIDDHYPSFLSHKSGYIQFAKQWNLGDKIIKIGAAETESQYQAVCWIYSKQLSDTFQASVNRKKREAVAEDASKF